VKPQGHWLNVHDRSLLDDGVADSHSVVIPAERAGIRGEFAQFAGPRTMAPYRAGMLYFHGGASLQEAIVPVLTVRLEPTAPPDVRQATVALRCKNGATRITTRVPVIEVSVESGNLFSLGAAFDILLEAHDRRGNVVGEAKAGDRVNPATGIMTLHSGERVQVPLKMQLEFEGKFTVKALTVKKLTLITSYEEKTQLAALQDKLGELQQSLLELDIVLDIQLHPNLHDREIRLDNGWVIKIGRGLDFYQRPHSWFEVGANDLSLRKCLETKVDIFKVATASTQPGDERGTEPARV
jgi:hypothetical protein